MAKFSANVAPSANGQAILGLTLVGGAGKMPTYRSDTDPHCESDYHDGQEIQRLEYS